MTTCFVKQETKLVRLTEMADISIESCWGLGEMALYHIVPEAQLIFYILLQLIICDSETE